VVSDPLDAGAVVTAPVVVKSLESDEIVVSETAAVVVVWGIVPVAVSVLLVDVIPFGNVIPVKSSQPITPMTTIIEMIKNAIFFMLSSFEKHALYCFNIGNISI